MDNSAQIYTTINQAIQFHQQSQVIYQLYNANNSLIRVTSNLNAFYQEPSLNNIHKIEEKAYDQFLFCKLDDRFKSNNFKKAINSIQSKKNISKIKSQTSQISFSNNEHFTDIDEFLDQFNSSKLGKKGSASQQKARGSKHKSPKQNTSRNNLKLHEDSYKKIQYLPKNYETEDDQNQKQTKNGQTIKFYGSLVQKSNGTQKQSGQIKKTPQKQIGVQQKEQKKDLPDIQSLQECRNLNKQRSESLQKLQTKFEEILKVCQQDKKQKDDGWIREVQNDIFNLRNKMQQEISPSYKNLPLQNNQSNRLLEKSIQKPQKQDNQDFFKIKRNEEENNSKKFFFQMPNFSEKEQDDGAIDLNEFPDYDSPAIIELNLDQFQK